MIILLEGCHDNPRQAPRGGVGVHGREREREREKESPRDTERERQREAGRGARETPHDIPNSHLQPEFSASSPSGPIHAAMSSLSSLGLPVDGAVGYQLWAGRPPELAGQSWSHGGRHPGTLHSQDEPQGVSGWSGGRETFRDSEGARAQGSSHDSCPAYRPGSAAVANGSASPCGGPASWHSWGRPEAVLLFFLYAFLQL